MHILEFEWSWTLRRRSRTTHKTIDLDPDLVPGHEILAIYEERGKLDEAIGNIERRMRSGNAS